MIFSSLLDRTLYVLGRAIAVAAPVGIVIWLLANIQIGGISLLGLTATFFDPFAKLMGLDGYILTAFILGSYMAKGSLVNLEDTQMIGTILLQNGWTLLTAINVMIFTLLHFPCSTTLLTIKKETGSWKWAIISFVLPTICGIVICMATTLLWNVLI